MTYYYAVLNEKSICMHITALPELIADNDKLVLLNSPNDSLVGKKRSKGEWVEAPPWEIVLTAGNELPASMVPEPTNAQVAQLVSDLYADLIIAGVIQV